MRMAIVTVTYRERKGLDSQSCPSGTLPHHPGCVGLFDGLIRRGRLFWWCGGGFELVFLEGSVNDKYC